MKKYQLWLLLVVTLFYSKVVTAEQISLKQVITEILQNSKVKKANEYRVKAATAEANRAANHWLPNLYLDNSIYQTNDAAKILMGNLGQKSVTQNDFAPDTINTTTTKRYSRVALGINLPLFQGGAGVAYAKAAKHLELAKKYVLSQTELAEYSKVAITYISIVSLEQQKKKLQLLKTKVDHFVKQYAIGEKGNPLGYSGLLGLQVLQHKITALLVDNDSKAKLLYTLLAQFGFTREKNWQVEHFSVSDYINKYLNYEVSNKNSFTINAKEEKVTAVKYQEKINKAKFLPTIKAFAENSIFTGARASKTGYTVGLNISWNLFDFSTYNTQTIVKNNYKSAKYAWLNQQQQENTEIARLKAQLQSLTTKLTLAKQSEQLMAENIGVSENMFKDGAINSQMLAAAIIQYLDTFVFLYNTELQLIDTFANKLTMQPIKVSKILASK